MIRRVYVGALALVVGAVLGTGSIVRSAAQAANDKDQVARVARDYFEGWYTADSDRLGRSLHPDMVKRYVDAQPGGRQVLFSVTREIMLEMTRAGGGSKVPAEKRNIVVEVIEVSGDIAVARASSSEYLEYLSLAKCNGDWVIVNILWRFQAAAARSR